MERLNLTPLQKQNEAQKKSFRRKSQSPIAIENERLRSSTRRNNQKEKNSLEEVMNHLYI